MINSPKQQISKGAMSAARAVIIRIHYQGDAPKHPSDLKWIDSVAPELARLIDREMQEAIREAADEAARLEREQMNSISLFLSVVRERLDCLKEYEYVEKCDALEILELNLDAAIGLAGAEGESK